MQRDEGGVLLSLSAKERKECGMSVIDKEKLNHWQSANIDDIIQLKDEQTISYLMDEGHENISHGADFTIKRKRKITAQDGNAEWLILDIEFADFTWYLVVKSDKSDFDLYCYYVADGFEDGDRADMVEKADWLLEEFTDGKELKDLSFSPEIMENAEVIFKTDGAKYGTCFEDGDKEFATVVEYATDAEHDNPLMMALEFNQLIPWEESEESYEEDEDGDVEIEVTHASGVHINEDSSYIMLLQGCGVALNDVDILRI
jgi:hypothetical protein